VYCLQITQLCTTWSISFLWNNTVVN